MPSNTFPSYSGSFDSVEDAEINEGDSEAQAVTINSTHKANAHFEYSATAEDRGTAGSLDGQPGIVYRGPSGITAQIRVGGFDTSVGSISPEATDEIDMSVFINSTDTMESDEGDQEANATLEWNVTSANDVVLTENDVIRFAISMAANNEDDAQLNIDSGTFTIRNVSNSGTAKAKASMYLSSTSATTISTATTPVLGAGTTAAMQGTTSSDLTVATTNRITNSDGAAKSFQCDVAVSLSHADSEGATQRLGVHLYKNGLAMTGIENFADVEANGRSEIGVHAVVELALDDYLEVWVSNQESTANVTVQSLNFVLTQV